MDSSFGRGGRVVVVVVLVVVLVVLLVVLLVVVVVAGAASSAVVMPTEITPKQSMDERITRCVRFMSVLSPRYGLCLYGVKTACERLFTPRVAAYRQFPESDMAVKFDTTLLNCRLLLFDLKCASSFV